MRAPLLETSDPSIHLIEPDVLRDAPLSLEWLDGPIGHKTLQLMGVADKDNKPTSLPEEQERIQAFIERKDQLNWMIEVDGKVIGSIWVDLEDSDELPSPAVHIMIGDPAARGRGIGGMSIKAVIKYLGEQGADHIYSRRLITNEASAKLLAENQFREHGEPYIDKDNLTWQNMVLDLPKQMLQN